MINKGSPTLEMGTTLQLGYYAGGTIPGGVKTIKGTVGSLPSGSTYTSSNLSFKFSAVVLTYKGGNGKTVTSTLKALSNGTTVSSEQSYSPAVIIGAGGTYFSITNNTGYGVTGIKWTAYELETGRVNMLILIVYDTSGYVLFTQSGETAPREPIGVPFIWMDVPEGKAIKGVDVKVTPHQVILEDIPPSEIDVLKQTVPDLTEIVIGGAK